MKTSLAGAGKSLSTVLNDPTRFLLSGSESFTLDEHDIQRRISLEIEMPQKGSIVIDVLRPSKGSLVNLELASDDSEVRRLDHDEHVRICRNLIEARFVKFIRTLNFSTPFALYDLFDDLENMLSELLRIPEKEPSRAKVLLDHVWNDVDPETPLPKFFDKYVDGRSLTCDKEEVLKLYRLTRMLERRYLVLLEVASKKKRKHVAYAYSQRLSHSPDAQPGDQQQYLLANGRVHVTEVKRSLLSNMRLAVDAGPNTVRAHIPLAKKCRNYRAQFDPPADYFIWWGGVLRDRQEQVADLSQSSTKVKVRSSLASARLMPSALMKWSSSLSHGRKLLAFVGTKHEGSVGTRAYLGLELMERPARASYRVALRLVATAMTCAALIFLAPSSPPRLVSAGALLAGLVGLVAASAENALPAGGMLATPAFPRVAGASTPFLAGVTALWLFTQATGLPAAPSWYPQWVASVLTTLGQLWTTAVGVVVVIVFAALSISMLYRVFIMMQRYRFVIDGNGNRINLYDLEGL